MLEPLITSPKLALYTAQLEDFLSKERQRRQQFYQDIHEDDNTEFINGEVVSHLPVKNVTMIAVVGYSPFWQATCRCVTWVL